MGRARCFSCCDRRHAFPHLSPATVLSPLLNTTLLLPSLRLQLRVPYGDGMNLWFEFAICSLYVVCGLRFVGCGLWFVGCGLWFVVVVCDLWFVVCGL